MVQEQLQVVQMKAYQSDEPDGTIDGRRVAAAWLHTDVEGTVLLEGGRKRSGGDQPRKRA